MIKRRFLRLICFIICVTLTFVACEPIEKVISFFSDDGTGYIFKIALSSDPKNLDPQLADDPSSVTVAKNLYAGLLEYDGSGRVSGKVAKDYTVSEDGLKYTFYLREGYKWHALGNYEYPVTADDFVYAFRRLMDPKTASPHSEKYFCIKNSEKARKGEIGVEEIGVSAPDSLTVIFELEYPNAEFLRLLSELPAAPCCEDFFITSGGKYGLEAEAVCSNGPFFVRYWLHDPYGKNNYIRIRRNPGYSDITPVSAGGVNYLITKDPEERLNDYNEGSVDMIVFPAGELAASDGEEYISESAGTAGIIFNENIDIFGSEELRQVFSWAIDREALKEASPDTAIEAKSIIPDGFMGYTPRTPEEVGKTDLKMAEYKWGFLLTQKQQSSLIGMTLMVPEDFGYADYLEAVSDSWYKVFATHISIENVTRRDYEERLSNGRYDLALAVIDSDGCAQDFLLPFGSDKSFGMEFDKAKELENNSGRFETLASLDYACSEAENEILSGYHFIPLWHLPSVCVYDDDCADIKFDRCTDTVFFENAKHY